MGISAPTANAKILYAASFVMTHLTALRHIVVRAANSIVLCDFVSARIAARFFAAPLGQVCAFQEQLPRELRPRPPPLSRRPSGREKATYFFRLIMNANLTSITGPYTSRTSIVIS